MKRHCPVRLLAMSHNRRTWNIFRSSLHPQVRYSILCGESGPGICTTIANRTTKGRCVRSCSEVSPLSRLKILKSTEIHPKVLGVSNTYYKTPRLDIIYRAHLEAHWVALLDRDSDYRPSTNHQRFYHQDLAQMGADTQSGDRQKTPKDSSICGSNPPSTLVWLAEFLGGPHIASKAPRAEASSQNRHVEYHDQLHKSTRQRHVPSRLFLRLYCMGGQASSNRHCVPCTTTLQHAREQSPRNTRLDHSITERQNCGRSDRGLYG